MLIIPAFVLALATPKPTALASLSPALVKTAMPSYTQNQRAIHVKAGEPFQIRMNVTSGTGYTWQPQAPIPPGLTLLGVFQRSNSKMLAGAAGEEVLVFRGSDAGTKHLVLQYVRPWEHNVKPAKTASFSVTVRK
jgi:predicted secreted protein